jgi:hypothetical protein
MYIFIFFTTFSENFLILRTDEENVIKYVLVFRQSTGYSLQY